MKKAVVILFTICILGIPGQAQDFHVSHYDVTGMYMNPAVTGFYYPERSNYRLYLLRRSQWKALGIKPFATNYVAYDRPTTINGRKFGLGGYLVNNSAGNYNTLNLMVSGAYDIINSVYKYSSLRAAKHLLSVGLQLGMLYKAVDPGNLTYDVQYSSSLGNFDQGMPSNETYLRSNLLRFDASYGIYYKMLDRYKKTRPFAGFSMYHLTRPRESLAGGESRLPIRFVAQAGCDIKMNDKCELKPRMVYMTQARAYDLSGGVLVFYKMKDDAPRLMAGIDYRLKDAVIVSIGGNTEQYALRFSYDFSASYLRNYLSGRSAFELSLVFSPERKRPGMSARALD